jgi:putative endonuclease
MTYQKRIGNQGEQIAAVYLESKGYRILEQNYHTRFGEIDLVAQEGDSLVFVEVKARTSTTFGLPEASVTTAKLEKIENAILLWLQDHPDYEDDWRIDVIAILLKKDTTVEDIQHFINVL